MEGKLTLNRRRFLKSAGAAAFVGTAGLLGAARKANAGEGKLATLIDLSLVRRLYGPGDAGLRLRLQDDQQGHDRPIAGRSDPGPLADGRRSRTGPRKTGGRRPAHPLQLHLCPEGGARERGTEKNRVRSRDAACTATTRPARPSARSRRITSTKTGRWSSIRTSVSAAPSARRSALGDPAAPVRRRHLSPGPADLHGKRGHGQVRSLQRSPSRGQDSRAASRPARRRRCSSDRARRSLHRRRRGPGRLKAIIYGKTENGGTSTLYVSPVPFETLSKTMKKEPGRPGLSRVQRQMAETDGLGKVVLAAPALGIAAGVAGPSSGSPNEKQG